MKQKAHLFTDKIIDCHTHSAGVDFFGMVKGHYPLSQDVDILSNRLKNNNIDYAITFPFPNTIYYDINSFIDIFQYKPSGLSHFPFEQENINLLNQVKHFQTSNLLPFLSFSLNDKVDEQIRNIETLVTDNYVYGLKYHTFTDHHSAKDIMQHPQILDCMREHDLPLLIHSGQQEMTSATHIYELAKAVPDVRFCAAHLGRFNKKFWQQIMTNPLPNLFVDMSPFINLHSRFALNKYKAEETLDCDTVDTLKALVYICKLLPDNLLWGTDSPYTHTQYLNERPQHITSYEDEVSLLKNLNDQTIKKVASKNTLRFIFGNRCNERH